LKAQIKKLIGLFVSLMLIALIGGGVAAYFLTRLSNMTVTFAPLKAGEYWYLTGNAFFAHSHSSGVKTLSPEQLKQIDKWLQEHQSGWSQLSNTPSPNTQELIGFTLQDANGQTRNLSVERTSDPKQPQLWLRIVPPKDATSGAGELVIQNFSEKDLQPLLELRKG
jgi:hypothetical protein